MAMAAYANQATLYAGGFQITKTLRKPPAPLGEQSGIFPYTAESPYSLSGNKHYSLTIHFNHSPHRPLVPGSHLSGTIKLQPRLQNGHPVHDTEFLKIQRVDFRVYCDSRTLFWHYGVPHENSRRTERLWKQVLQQRIRGMEERDVQLGMASGEDEAETPELMSRPLPSGPARVVDNTRFLLKDEEEFFTAHEWHRSYIERRTIETSTPDQPILVPLSSSSPTEFPFSFLLPTTPTIQIDESNVYANAPRDLATVHRPLPPTCRDNNRGSVEWLVEAIVSLQPPEDDPDGAYVLKTDDKGLLRFGKGHLVARKTFDFLPEPPSGMGWESGYRLDCRGFSDQPGLGAHNAVLVSEDTNRDPMSGRPIYGDGDPECAEERDWTIQDPLLDDGKWRRFRKWKTVESERLKRNIGQLDMQVAIPSEDFLFRDTRHLPIKLRLLHTRFPSRLPFSPKKQSPVSVDHIEVFFYRRTLTRGGADPRPHQSLQLCRYQSFPASLSLTPSKPEIIEVSFDLQTPMTNLPSSHPGDLTASYQTPISSLTPSFKMPNFERTYILQVFLHLKNGTQVSVLRVPIRLVCREQEQLPSFNEAMQGEGRPPSWESGDEPVQEWREGTSRVSEDSTPSYRTEDPRSRWSRRFSRRSNQSRSRDRIDIARSYSHSRAGREASDQSLTPISHSETERRGSSSHSGPRFERRDRRPS